MTVPSEAPATYRIGELAELTGRSVHTIRWYEAQGLIPGVIRDGGGRRVYRPEHVQWLDLMARLRRTGMPIAEMRRYTTLVQQGHSTLKQQQELLAEHRSRVEQELQQWRRALKLIDRKIDFYGEWLATGKRPEEDPERPRGRRRG